MQTIAVIDPLTRNSGKADAETPGSASNAGHMSFLFGALGASTRISLNKITHRFFSPYVDSIKIEITPVDLGGDVKEIRIVANSEVLGRLTYYCVNGKSGNPKVGGSHASEYLGDNLVAPHLDAKRKKRVIRQLLAQLPPIPELMFCSIPNAKDSDVMVQAFKSAGFRSIPITTYTYFEEPNSISIADRLTRKTGNDVRAGRKHVTVYKESAIFGPDEFFDLYERNLGGKINYFDFEDERVLLRQLTKAGLVHYIILGKKDSDESSIDTAMACVHSKDGYIKIWRSTFPRGAVASKSHPRANRYALSLAMDYAREMGMTLDTDGATPGTEDLYKHFSDTLKPAVRQQFHYRTVGHFIGYYYPSVATRAASYLPTKLASKFGL